MEGLSGEDHSTEASPLDMPTAPPSVPAGWYVDPDDPRQQRYWDGARWSDQIAPRPEGQPDPPSRSTARTVSLLSCVGLVIGAWAPWATTVLVSASGTDGDGKYTGLFGLIAGIVLFNYSGRRPGWLTAVGVFAILSLLVALDNISNVSSYTTNFFGEDVHVVSVGWGLWLTALSSLTLTIGVASWRSEARRQIARQTKVTGT